MTPISILILASHLSPTPNAPTPPTLNNRPIVQQPHIMPRPPPPLPSLQSPRHSVMLGSRLVCPAALPLLLLPLLLSATPAAAHEHSDSIAPPASAQDLLNAEPIDSVLSLHIIVQLVAWGLLYPLGMVFGLTRSRWHVPVQTLATILTAIGFILGHSHGGRKFPVGAHSSVASAIVVLLAVQVTLGVYLKLHIHEGTRFRQATLLVHGILGKAWPIVSWLQIMLGVVTGLGFCFGEHLMQCLAHLIMGSGFVVYGAVYAIMLRLGSRWLAQRGHSQEYIDSWVLTIWGVINTFTEHHGGPWSHKDLQHTSMGIVWWFDAFIDLTKINSIFYLSARSPFGLNNSPIPALLLIFTGFAFGAHAQDLVLSAQLHGIFGTTLMLTGVVRIIEITFVLRDQPADSENILSFQHLPPFLLMVSGIMFMTVTEEQLDLVSAIGVDHATYILCQISVASIVYLWTNVLISAYATSGRNASKALGASTASPPTTQGSEAYRPLVSSTSNPNLFGGRDMLSSTDDDRDDEDTDFDSTERP
ncbi:hypothetical protein HDU87_004148 [Geranomyces variabilis]|uniref:Integral membrane protein n=1 Tax=Geranomyces variabilis TaxID=109894 RepID=A0AAD5TJZ9_9FUNG|nr:hypothetical protein HDU87_004148 [Geranomyces variabilis]